MLLFCAKTIVKESRKFELARLKKKNLKKKKKEKHFGGNEYNILHYGHNSYC